MYNEEANTFPWDSWLNYDNVCEEGQDDKSQFIAKTSNSPIKNAKVEKKCIPGASTLRNYFITKSEPNTMEILERYFEQIINKDAEPFHSCKSKTCGTPNTRTLSYLSELTSVSKDKLKAWFEQKSDFFHSGLAQQRSAKKRCNSLVNLEQINENIRIIRKNIEAAKIARQ